MHATTPHRLELRARWRSFDDPRSDAELVVAIVESADRRATAALYERYGNYVEKLLVRLLGPHDRELEDLLHDVFAEALANLGKLQDPGALKGWLTRIAVFQARTLIRKRSRGRWLRFFAPSEVPEAASAANQEASEKLKRVYACLEKLDAEERVAFVLRELHQMTLPEVAGACDCSLATAKRRIARGRARFEKLAADDPQLSSHVESKVQPGGGAS